MKVLWIVNMVLPPLAADLGIQTGNSGTWMFDIAKQLDADPNIQLAVACVYGKQFQMRRVGKTDYYCLPGTGRDMMFYRPQYRDYWKKIVDAFQPDVVNIHGTEYCHALSFLRTFPELKTVISLQGLMTKIQNYDLAGLSLGQLLRYRTLREWTHFNGMLEYHVYHKKNARSEMEMLKTVNNCMVVDNWHRSVAYEINPNLRFFTIRYNLRDAFYHAPKWDVTKIDRYTITTNPGGTALKGLHQLFKAVAIVRKQYPAVKVLVPGMAADQNGLKETTGYAKYLKSLIHKLEIEENVAFLGSQSCEQMVNNMLRAHVQVIPSAIEGPSLVLHEGMHLGTPSIASFRGGMMDFIEDKKDGFLYDYGEYQYLALRILQIFDSDELAVTLSQNAIAKSEKVHDRSQNYQDYIKMYMEICE